MLTPLSTLLSTAAFLSSPEDSNQKYPMSFSTLLTKKLRGARETGPESSGTVWRCCVQASCMLWTIETLVTRLSVMSNILLLGVG